MRRRLYEPEHEEFRHLVRKIIEHEVTPFYEQWRADGIVPRDLFRTLGAVGVMGFSVPEEFGGGGTGDYRYNVVVQEEAARAVVTLGGLRTHLDIVLPYLLALADTDQRARWFPGLATGDLYTAIAMSEPGSAPTSPGSAPPPAATASTTSSTGRRRSSPAGNSPTS